MVSTMIVLTLENIQKSFAGKPVLKRVSLTLQTGERMGLVGANGCGKSTLLRMISGRESIDEGLCSVKNGCRIGYLEQQYRPPEGMTVIRVLEEVFAPVQRTEEKLRALEKSMEHAGGAELESAMREYTRLMALFENSKGYMWRSLVQGALVGMGFAKDKWEQEASTLSGGELTRLCLARLLLEEPDVLLLDEPTNHLDLEALTWLEDYLSQYPGAVIVVSHDRYFLDRVCTRIHEIVGGASEDYTGNYSSYITQRAERFESRMRSYQLQQAEIERQEKVIARLRSFNREKSIKRAESRQKALDKIERLERPESDQHIRFSFDIRRKTGEDVLDVRDYEKSFGDRPLFDHISFQLKAGDRVALMGRNGIGKTTLFKCLMGIEKPDAGFVRWGANVDLGYYDQLQADLHEDKTILREVWDRFVRLSQTEVRSALGLFLFTGEEVFQPIATLSGGERGRVLLTELMLRKDNVLLLDEPTNHLDADSREVLESVLEDYPGTILAISHDRYFIDRFASRLLIMRRDGIDQFNGNYSEYQQYLTRQSQGGDDGAPGVNRTALQKEKRRQRLEADRLKAAKAEVSQAEKAVAELEEKIAQMEGYLSRPDVATDREKSVKAAGEYRALQEALDTAYQRWETAEKDLNALLAE
ncbi:MAG: ABC-F family ATP-binding cassette domain-containing protein [Clostridia bacterium]|nr:ABC-F family ATP-binding cassette domain-containing protein [Clostridia bacterium]